MRHVAAVVSPLVEVSLLVVAALLGVAELSTSRSEVVAGQAAEVVLAPVAVQPISTLRAIRLMYVLSFLWLACTLAHASYR